VCPSILVPGDTAVKLYVDNLAYATTVQQLNNAFAAHGTVLDCRIPLDKRTGIYQGFGYVVMPQDSEAKKAIKALNATVLDGNKIRVRESRMKKKGVSAAVTGTAENRFGNPPSTKFRINRMGVPRVRKSQDR